MTSAILPESMVEIMNELLEKWQSELEQFETFRVNYLKKAELYEATDPKRSAKHWGNAKFLEGKINAYKNIIHDLQELVQS